MRACFCDVVICVAQETIYKDMQDELDKKSSDLRDAVQRLTLLQGSISMTGAGAGAGGKSDGGGGGGALVIEQLRGEIMTLQDRLHAMESEKHRCDNESKNC